MALKNEIGNTYGYLTVIERADNSKEGRARWLCQCECGNTVVVLGKHLRSGNTKSCGCYQKERAIESNIQRGGGDLVGQRFGKLKVISFSRWITRKNGKRNRMWLCKCDCGNQCEVLHEYLRCGDTNSCGCINSVGNMTINRILQQKGINYTSEFYFSDFLTKEGHYYRFDFAIFDKNNNLICLIEYQGDIHFICRNSGWNTIESFKKRQVSDKEKLNYCLSNNIKLYYITYEENIEERMEEILNELYSK